jgi:phage repressor protein C with HTH and peptisase S24 domain
LDAVERRQSRTSAVLKIAVQVRVIDRTQAEIGWRHASVFRKAVYLVDQGLDDGMNVHGEQEIQDFSYPVNGNFPFPLSGANLLQGGMDLVRKLIEQRIKELGLNYAEVSRRLDRNETYLQQFLKKGSPRELHERDRLLLAEILKVSQDDLRGPSTVLPKRNYEKKQSGASQSLLDATTHAPQGQQGSPAVVVPSSSIFGTQLDLPVFGTAQGGQDGALIVSELAVDYVGRPPALLRVRDGYGMIVSGDSMSPEHKEGSIALVNPHLPPRSGDSCVFRSHADDGTNLALIKEYRGQTETHWKVRQHNPPKDFQLKKSDWQICHRTIGNYFP